MSVNSKFKKYLPSEPTGAHANLRSQKRAPPPPNKKILPSSPLLLLEEWSRLILDHWSDFTSAIYFVNGCETEIGNSHHLES